MNWDEYFLSLCNSVSLNSKCLSRKLGCVIEKNNYIISTGYNGPPKNCNHCSDSYYRKYIFNLIIKENAEKYGTIIDDGTSCPRRASGYISGEGLQYCQSSHAERNAIYTAAKLGHAIDGCTLYLNWVIPCVECCKAIINSGITEVVVTELKNYETSGMPGSFLLNKAGIKLRTYVL